MTTINCTSNCFYQKDGKCCFENTLRQNVTPNSKCAYYLEKKVTTKK